MALYIFTRTMARVEDGQGQVTYRCMVCARRAVPVDKLPRLLAWQGVQSGAGMFTQTWHLVQTRQPCVACEAS
ncbi:MAG: hypothetical protein H0X24_21270 [Ktedonobacterales bacterium]|nr:hypothetical protein [Ktedonobacterales bacterium]